jgi:hypothetical protein
VTRSFACVSILLASFFVFAPLAMAQGGNPSSSATFLRTDATTLGNWHAAYGADGYSVAGNGQNLPGYASFAVQNQADYTWTNNTTDTRALQTADGSNRIAAVWYNASAFNFDVNLADGNPHQFALYALDWDSSGRVETIQIVDATTQTVLDTESISSFTNGVYLVWNITGHVQINISKTAGNSAVVNGVFFGGSSVVSSVASFVRTDASTQGNWHGAYGADGYSIANDSQSIPSYASFAVQNQQNFTWSDPPTDVRALETGNGSNRIASVWYNTPEFNFDLNLTDGNSHQFALYAVDWDNSGRAETIQILDAATDALLDTRSISNFTNGLFLVWNIKGHVKLNVIQTAGNNAVVSGVFFGANSTISSSAAFLRTDTTTQGNWHGTYGSDGYSVANDSQSLPSYSSFAVQNQQDFTWSTSPTDTRSLQTGSASGRIAAVWYNTPEFNFDVNFTDGNSHQFALYAVDWDSSGRAETIQILDAATDALLDTRSISNFTNGLYLVWNVSGHVKINVIQTAGNNSVVSGVFFGGGSTINSTASFVRTDTTTKGSWHGTYGSDGYSIANDSQSIPSYANFAVQNQANWTWLSLTTDPRALQTGSNSGSIAATWYNTPEFNLDVNLTDGQSHQLALYAIDWDSSGRAETIELLDAATGALLDSRNISSFVNGLYLVWNVSGHVKINVIQTAGNNAVVSGIFFATPVASPSITSVSPNAGSAGTSVTITGSNFGPTQGNSSVSFNGTPGVPTSWSNTQVIVPVPSGATTGNVVLTVPGGASNGVSFTVTGSAPPSITASIFPSPNSAGWFNTNVTLSYSCIAGGAPLAPSSCPSPQIVATEGANQQVVASVTDTAGVTGTFSTTLSIDKTPPVLVIASPSDGTAYSSAGVTILGSVSDSLSGLASMGCNGTVVPVTSGTFSCNISLAAGVNLVMVLATDAAGNRSGARLHLTYSAALPAPTSLQITPTTANVLVSGTQRFTAVDQLGRPRSDAAWSVDNTSIATISSDSPPVLTGVAAGTVDLTASVGGVSTQVQVNILSGTSLTPGTVLWSAPSIPGFMAEQIVQAVPTGNGPDIYSNEVDTNGNRLIRAFSSDGQHMWQASPAGPGALAADFLSALVPDGLGGTLFRSDQAYSVQNPSTHQTFFADITTYADLDAATGSQAWGYTSPGQLSRPAIRQDGTIFLAETSLPDLTNGGFPDSTSLLALDGTVGTPTLRQPLPGSEFQTYDSNNNLAVDYKTGPQRLSNLAIDLNGNVALLTESEIEATTRDGGGNTTSLSFTSTLSLFQLKSDGSTSLTPIHTNTGNLATIEGIGIPSAWPGSLIPDGQGGWLASWTDHSLTQLPVYVTHVTPSGSSDYPFPILYCKFGCTSMVLGENGAAYITDTQTIQAFDITSGQSLWAYTSPAVGGIDMIASATNGVLVAKEFDDNNFETVVRLDSSGQPTYDGSGSSTPSSGFGTLLQSSWTGHLVGLPSGAEGLAGLATPIVDWAHSFWAAEGGSPSPAGASVEMPWFPPLATCPGAQTPCAGDAIEDAFSSLQTLIAKGCSSGSNCQTYVLGKSQLGLTTTNFANYLSRPHHFYDATRSHAKVGDVLCRNPIIFTCNVTATQFNMTIIDFWEVDKPAAITKTPSSRGEGLVTFWDPGQVNLALNKNNAAGAKINQANIFHEALHGDTGIIDNNAFHAVTNLEDIFGICYEPSVAISKYISFYIFGLGTAPTTQSSSIGPCTNWP